MKITAITIENFKGISEPVRVELKPITLLFGANSVGIPGMNDSTNCRSRNMDGYERRAECYL
jgi:predicted ATPase